MLKYEFNRFWKSFLDIIQDGVLIIDTEGIIISVNRALQNMLGYCEQEMIGKPCSLLNCDRCHIVRKGHDEVGPSCALFQKGTLKMLKCGLMKKDGSYVHVFKNAAVLHDEEGKVIGAMETITDISDLVEKDKTIEAFRRELQSEDGFHGILGSSNSMQRVYGLISDAAKSDAPVILLGESGTGKELVSKAIHEISSRRKKPFVQVNCAALNEYLLESELFGHVKGAYTGAYKNREGRFEAAQSGVLFLDEIGDLPLHTQVKLLRAIEEKIIERVGDNSPISVNVRIVTATNRNLAELVDQGSFREDLFYRINVIPISIPPLRERTGDIPILADTFFRRIQMKSDKAIKGISKDTMGILMEHPWPGNVRELKSAFEYAFVSCHESMIQPFHLPPSIYKLREPAPGEKPITLKKEEMKKAELIAALKKSYGNQTRAAEILGVTRVTVWHRIKKYGIDLKKDLSSL